MQMSRLRTLLLKSPSPKAWRELCFCIEVFEDPGERTVAVDYVEAHLNHWPDRLRIPLYRWWKQIGDGEGFDCRRLIKSARVALLARAVLV